MLDTYTNLQASIASWMARSDLTTQIVDFIALAEAEFNRVLRVRQMEQRSTATAAEYMALPTGFLELRDIQLNTTPKVSLQLVSASQMENYSSASGQPLAYCIMANQIQLAPVPDSTYTLEIDYYEVVPPLASNSTNWMLTSYPDAYLYGSLLRGAGFIQDANLVQTWRQEYGAVLQEIRIDDKRARFGGGQMRVRAA